MSTDFDAALVHAIGGILILGYSMEYYFHLRMYFPAIKLFIYPFIVGTLLT
jgi:F-type H+-transporting ATPase subunit f